MADSADKPTVALFIETSRAYGRDLCLGIADYSRSHGEWNFLIQERDLRGGIPEWLETWNGDGILCRLSDPELADLFAKASCPVVDLYGQIRHPDIPFLDTDASAVADIAARFFVNSAFTSFAFCGFPGLWFSDDRSAAFQKAVNRYGAEVHVYEPPVSWKVTDVARRESLHPTGSPELAKWIRSLPPRTAILACNDVRAQQLIKVAAAVGRGIPEDLAVMGVDDDQLICELSSPRLTSVRPDTRVLGYTAAHWLHQLMQGRTLPYHQLLVPPVQITERASTDTIASDDEILVKALRFIRDHAHESLDTSQVIDHVGSSRSSVDKRFRKALGRTVKSEIVRARLNRASILLRETEMSLEKVANACGFTTASHFLRIFKREFGVTPGEFRRGPVADAPSAIRQSIR
ncbi:XylR family transcriptional regulator [Haloferula helveola]|uniref:XylR family transcriptional regulator n=1 Tax=Haloferula helveola TaxID=490095 RepID=A0ABM7RDG4_9BACT|nr:XylR family transcriptional regulator [Haloferula helveola]